MTWCYVLTIITVAGVNGIGIGKLLYTQYEKTSISLISNNIILTYELAEAESKCNSNYIYIYMRQSPPTTTTTPPLHRHIITWIDQEFGGKPGLIITISEEPGRVLSDQKAG